MARSARVLVVLALCAGIVSCTTTPPTRPPVRQPQRTPPSPTPLVPFVSTTTTLNFDGTMAAPFEDPTTEDQRRTGRWSMGRWALADNTYRQTRQVDTATLMFQRYTGDGFGQPNGMAPSKYRLEVTVFAYQAVTATESVIAGAPVGILGLIPYYLDATHYILVEAVKNRYEVWFVDGLTPGDEWAAETYQKYAGEATSSLAVNEPIKYKIDVDTKAGLMRLYINDELKEVISDPKFIKDVQHSFALVSNGNYIAFKDVKLTPFSAD